MTIFLKGKVLEMNEYEINTQTLAIIPINKNKSKIIEKNKEFTINSLTGITYKSPIIIEESRKMIFFPTSSPRSSSCIWLSFNNIDDYYSEGNDSIIKFCCGKVIKLHVSFTIIDNQVLRSTRLESILGKRIQNFIKII